MLRKFFFGVVAVAAMVVAAPAQAQNGGKIGLGVAIVPLDPALGTTIEVYVPLMVAPNFRIEPEVGIKTASNDAGDSSDITIGAGFFAVQKAAQNADMYFGGRLKLNFASVKPSGGTSTSATDIELAAAAGGEYYLAPKFSIGVEGQLGFYSLGKVNGAGGLSTTGFFTTGLGFLRFYM